MHGSPTSPGTYSISPGTIGAALTGSRNPALDQLEKAAAQVQQYRGTDAPAGSQRGLFTALGEVEDAFSSTQQLTGVIEQYFQLTEPENESAMPMPTAPKERLDYLLSRIRRTNYKLEKIAQHIGT